MAAAGVAAASAQAKAASGAGRGGAGVARGGEEGLAAAPPPARSTPARSSGSSTRSRARPTSSLLQAYKAGQVNKTQLIAQLKAQVSVDILREALKNPAR